ncbi:MAG: glycerophosphodiester phosphodiesterase family protein [Acidimicrobiales bacterium]
MSAVVCLAGVCAVAAGALFTAAAAGSTPRRTGETAFTLEGHRGARGLRPENTLAAFGAALQVGVTTLELDTGVTKDGVVVVSHERRLSSLECRDTGPLFPGDPLYPYVGRTDRLSDGKLIRELTLAQIKTLDCGARHPLPADRAADPFLPTIEAVPGASMPTLAEVFELAERYGAAVQFDIETKIDPTAPGDTVDPETFAATVVEVIERYGMTERSMLQSFDWRTLRSAQRLAPGLRLVALAQAPTIFPGTPWTAGLEVRSPAPFDEEVATLAREVGAWAISVRYPDLTDSLIEAARRYGMAVVAWTVNDPADMARLIERGVDGLITDYPDRARVVMAAHGLALPPAQPPPFDIQAHRGGRAHRPENTLAAFAWALEHRVTTLELDVGVTKDDELVVVHDRRVNAEHCRDTLPVEPGDPAYPYVGRLVRELTLAQVRTLDCGYASRYPAGHPLGGQKEYPDQVELPGSSLARIPTLQEVFDLVDAAGDDTVRFNIETKLSPDVDDAAPFDEFTSLLVGAVRANGLERRVMIQSFDWRTIRMAKELAPDIETVALVWQFGLEDCGSAADECSLQARVGDPTLKSTWTAGLDWWEHQDLARLVIEAGADVVSANWQVHDPDQIVAGPADRAHPDAFYQKQDPSIFHEPGVHGLHAAGLRVTPYTVNDAQVMQRLIDLGVDGIIADDIVTLLAVAKRNGLR